jgi:oligo-1,6-glucosidase
MLLTFLLTMRATPYIYMGDEIGMANIRFDDINEYRDIDTLNRYKQIQKKGGELADFIEGQKSTGRDNARTPFQWNKNAHAGFTSGMPWIKVNEDSALVNADVQETIKNSVLNYFRFLVQLRKQNPVFVYGDYKLVDNDNEQVYAYIRSLEKEKILVVLNFSNKDAPFFVAGQLKMKQNILSNNYQELEIKEGVITMKPYQAIILRFVT